MKRAHNVMEVTVMLEDRRGETERSHLKRKSGFIAFTADATCYTSHNRSHPYMLWLV